MTYVDRIVPVLCLVSLSAGCSGSNTPATAKVAGLVTYRGSPVDAATVIFAPAAGGRPATAITDAQGRYELSTFGEKDGAVPGAYNATVIKTVIEGTVPKLTNDEIYELQRQGKPVPVAKTKSVLPDKYGTANTSDLNVTVKPGDNDIPLTLND